MAICVAVVHVCRCRGREADRIGWTAVKRNPAGFDFPAQGGAFIVGVGDGVGVSVDVSC